MARRPPPTPPSARRSGREAARGVSARSPRPGRRRAWAAAAALAIFVVTGVASAWVWHDSTRPERLQARAEAATRAGDWPAALAAWRAVNASPRARGATYLAEARAALALGRSGEAEAALARANAADPTAPEPWRLRLEVLRVEDDPIRAQEVGWTAYDAVPPDGRRGVLRELTLALLADLPDDLARRTLARWAEAGASPASNVDARVAYLQRVAVMPRSGDPDRDARLRELTDLVRARPDNNVAREALVAALAEAGDPDRGREALDAWPLPDRDARYWRLRGRWDLEYDRQYAAAVEAFRRSLAVLPHDWKTRVRLARALQHLGLVDEARAEADIVARLRELLDPAALGPRLAADLDPARGDDPKLTADLADLCARAGLTRLADAWRRESLALPARPSATRL